MQCMSCMFSELKNAVATEGDVGGNRVRPNSGRPHIQDVGCFFIDSSFSCILTASLLGWFKEKVERAVMRSCWRRQDAIYRCKCFYLNDTLDVDIEVVCIAKLYLINADIDRAFITETCPFSKIVTRSTPRDQTNIQIDFYMEMKSVC